MGKTSAVVVEKEQEVTEQSAVYNSEVWSFAMYAWQLNWSSKNKQKSFKPMNSPAAIPNQASKQKKKSDQLKTNPHFLAVLWPRAAAVVVGKLGTGLASDLHKCQAAQGVMLEETCSPSHLTNPLFSFTDTCLDIYFFKTQSSSQSSKSSFRLPHETPKQCWDSQVEPFL